MNAYASALRGYAANAASTRTDRRTEYDVIARVTHRLRDTAKAASTNYPAFAEALHENRQLWTALAVDVADADNGLPNALRARVFYLAEFTQHQTRKILREKSSVLPLLEVNMAVLRGLKAERPGA